MDFITGKHISRREVLRGMGAAVALPFLDAMVPAGRGGALARATVATEQTRLVTIEMVHGAAGSNTYGASKHLWSPANVGSCYRPYGFVSSVVSALRIWNAPLLTTPNIREDGGSERTGCRWTRGGSSTTGPR